MTVRFAAGAVELLEELAAHNDRGWFAQHADEYRQLLVEPFERVLVEASGRLGATVWPVTGDRRTMARPLRDQRYAREAPYRTCVRGLLTSTGRTPTREGCVHLELSATGGFVGVGFHRPPRPVLDPIRRRILAEPAVWEEVRVGLAGAGRSLTPDLLRRIPSGFTTQADHPHADDLRLRSLEFVDALSVADWTSGAVVDRLVAAATDGAALLRFGNTAEPTSTSSVELDDG